MRLAPGDVVNERAIVLQDWTYTPDVIQLRIGEASEEAAQALIEELYDAKARRLKPPYIALLTDLSRNSHVRNEDVSLLRLLLRAASVILLLKEAMRP